MTMDPRYMALRTLYQTLLDSDPARLRVIARQWGVDLAATRKPDMAAELMTGMASNEAVTRVLDQLTPGQRTALDDLLRHDGAVPWAVFVHRAGEVRVLGPGRVEREELWRAPASAAEALWHLGLVQRAFDDWEGHPVEIAFVPEDLRLYAPAPSPLDIPDLAPASSSATWTAVEDTLADNLVDVWADVQRASGGPLDLSNLDERRRLLVALSLEQGWLRRDADGQVRPVAKAMLAWLQADPWTQWTSLAEAWLTSKAWDDLAHVSSLRPDPALGWPGHPEPPRQGIANLLGHCLANTAYDIESFVAYVKEHATFFLRRDGDYETWAPRAADSEVPLRGFTAWDEIEGALIRHTITGPLHWLGLLDLGSNAAGGETTAFRLTEAAAATMQDAPPPTFPEPDRVQLHEGAVLSVPRRRRYERFQLSRIADALDTPLAEAVHYRLSPTSLRRAKQQRIPLARIIAFLTEATGSKVLPAHLQAAVRRAYGERSPARLGQHWLLRVADPATLDEPEITALTVHRMAPTIATLRVQDRAQACRVLLKNGILVDLDET